MIIRELDLSEAAWTKVIEILQTANQDPEGLAKEAIVQNCSPEEVAQHNDRLIAEIKARLEKK